MHYSSTVLHFGFRTVNSSRKTFYMWFILHALSALSEALTALKHKGPWETLFPILLLESVVNFSGRDVFSNEEFDHNACSTLRGTFCSLITLATPRQDTTGSNPSRRKGGSCGFTLSRSHSCCAVRFYTQISPGHIWTTLYHCFKKPLTSKIISGDESARQGKPFSNTRQTHTMPTVPFLACLLDSPTTHSWLIMQSLLFHHDMEAAGSSETSIHIWPHSVTSQTRVTFTVTSM